MTDKRTFQNFNYGDQGESVQNFFDGDSDLMDTSYLIKKLQKRKYLVQLEKKDILAAPGDKIDQCYLIEKGMIIAYELCGGNRRIFDCYEKNTLVFCEHALIERPACMFYEALEPVSMYSIRMSFVKKLLINDPKFANCFLTQVTRNLLVTQDLFRKTITHSARWRVCDFLLVFAERASETIDGKIVLNQRISQQLLADMLYMNRITVLREVHALEEMGLFRMKNGHFEIPDLNLLRKYRDECV